MSRGCCPACRAPAIRRGGTRTAASPIRSRSPSSRRVRCRHSSIAKTRCGQRAAHATASRCPSGVATTVLSASLRPASSTATRVCVRSCASTPTTTIAPDLLESASRPIRRDGRRTRLYRGADQAPIKSRRPFRRVPGGRHNAEQPRPSRAAKKRANPPDPTKGYINAKKAEAVRRISLARRSSRFSRSSTFSRSRSSVVNPGRCPPSIGLAQPGAQ